MTVCPVKLLPYSNFDIMEFMKIDLQEGFYLPNVLI